MEIHAVITQFVTKREHAGVYIDVGHGGMPRRTDLNRDGFGFWKFTLLP